MIWLILIIASVLRVLNLNQSFWLDEAAQVIESSRPLPQQLDISADFWPPLYHLILHFWMQAGNTEIWIRLLSVIFSVATIFILYLLAKNLFNQKIALLGAFFLAIGPFHIWYAQEARPYSMSAFLGLLATHFFIKKQRVRYVISGILFVYSSYLAFFLLIAHGVFVYIYQKKSLLRYLKNMAVICATFIPWLPYFAKQLSIGRGLTSSLPGWSEAVSTPIYKALPLTFTKFILGRITIVYKIFYGLLVASLFLIASYLVLEAYKKHQQRTVKLSVLLFLPILIAFVFSFFIPILAPQRVLYVLPFFYLLLAVGINSLKKADLVFLSLFVCVSLYSLYLYYTNPRFQREQWRQAVAYVEDNRTADSIALFVFPEPFAPWQWYSGRLVYSLAVAPALTVKAGELASFKTQILPRDRIFYFHYLTDLTDPQRITQQFLLRSGFIETSTNDFPGVGFITIYEKALAKY